MAQYSYTFTNNLETTQIDFIESTIKRGYDVEHVHWDAKKVIVSFRESISEEEFAKLIDRLVYLIRFLNCKNIYENHPERSCATDPMNDLLASGDVQKVDRGMFLFQGIFWKLFCHFNNYWRNKALDLGAIEQEYPVLWPVDLYRKINYFSEFPQQVILATTVKPNSSDLKAVADKYEYGQDYKEVKIDEHMNASHYGLQCAVCDICYYALEGSRDFKNTVYTTYNKVFRNEVSETESLDRLTNFSVRDIMFVGTQEFVLEYRQKMIDLAIEFIKQFDLDCRITTANDPFFSNESILKSIFQNASELKYELLAKLPFNDKELAIGSINFHQDFFGRAFDIRLPDDGYAWSGCLGIGFERLVYALYSQFGTDISNWPIHIRSIVSPVDDKDKYDEIAKKIVASVLGISESDINETTSSENVEQWDSLRHMKLVVTLEETFGIQFSLDDIPNMRAYDQLLSVLSKKVK